MIKRKLSKKLKEVQSQKEANNDQNVLKEIQLPQLPQEKPQGIRIKSLQELSKNHQIRKFSHNQCPVCLEDFEKLVKIAEKLVELDPCEHLLCQQCMQEWISKYKLNCPICRSQINEIWPLQGKTINTLERNLKPLEIKKKEEYNFEQDDFYIEFDQNDMSLDFCMVCKNSNNYYLMLICDKCNLNTCHVRQRDNYFQKTLCDPALQITEIPEEKWYCLDCRINESIYYKQKKKYYCEDQVYFDKEGFAKFPNKPNAVKKKKNSKLQ